MQVLASKAAQCHRPERWPEALDLYRRILALQPDDSEALCNLATACKFLGQGKAAAAHLIHALALRPDHAHAAYSLGALFHEAGHLNVAIAAYRGAVASLPQLAGVYANLARCREECGLEDGSAERERALALDPRDSVTLMNRATAQLYRPGADPAKILDSARAWAALQPPPKDLPARALPKTPRLGFVSGDFRGHAVARLILPALEGLRAAGHDLSLYMTLAKSDDFTTRFQRVATRWRHAAALSDAALRAQIIADEIDILIDLSGFTVGNRLGVFAERSAPLQLAWAGYPATTGLAAMDYLLGDGHQLPPGANAFFTEKLIRLPDSYVACPPPAGLPPLAPLPALSRGFVTFGSFNAAKKLNPELLALWSRILQAVPGSRLVLKADAYSLPGVEPRFRARFAEMGVAPERLGFAGSTGWADHLQAMAGVDIALDSFPYSGGQTTLESLWSGLPVVTRPGETMASRHATGYLRSAGLAELVAEDARSYCELAAGLAADLPRLAKLRAGMRERLEGSKLCDVAAFVRNLETALTAIWNRRLAPHQYP
jgi:protein O-GlcNAc transferase